MYGGQDVKRGLAIQAVDINTGNVVIFDEKTPKEDFVSAVMSSASIPLVFPPT